MSPFPLSLFSALWCTRTVRCWWEGGRDNWEWNVVWKAGLIQQPFAPPIPIPFPFNTKWRPISEFTDLRIQGKMSSHKTTKYVQCRRPNVSKTVKVFSFFSGGGDGCWNARSPTVCEVIFLSHGILWGVWWDHCRDLIEHFTFNQKFFENFSTLTESKRDTSQT